MKKRLRASGAGGCDFGYGYRDDNSIDLSLPNAFVWMTGDNLCSPAGACNNPSTGAFNDTSWVDGMQGTPDDLAKDVMPEAAMSPPPAGPATPPDGPSTSYMIEFGYQCRSERQSPRYRHRPQPGDADRRYRYLRALRRRRLRLAAAAGYRGRRRRRRRCICAT